MFFYAVASTERIELPRITIVPSRSLSFLLCSSASASVTFMNTSYPRSTPLTLRPPLSSTTTDLSKY